MKKIRILIVDDEILLLESLELILSMHESFQVAGVAHDGREALDVLSEKEADIALVDLNMSGMSGQQLILKIKEKYTAIKILILTTFYDEENIVSAIRHGADGYLLKDAGTKVIVQGIINVINGQSMLDSKVMNALADVMVKCYNETADKETNSNSELLRDLSDREVEICHMLSEGYTNSQIAEYLYISEGTVKNYISIIYDKTGIRDRTILALKLAKLFA